MSFGFKHGIPEDVMVYDVRKLFDPFYIANDKDGLDENITKLVLEKGGEKTAQDISREIQSNDKDKVFAIGCKGGKHRSVVVVERIAQILHISSSEIVHRDINK